MQEIIYLHSYFGIKTDKKLNLSESHLKRSDWGVRIWSMSWKVPWLQSAGTANPRESPMCDWVKQGNTFAGTSSKGNRKRKMNVRVGLFVYKSITGHKWQEKEDTKWKWNDNKFNDDINKNNTASNENGDKRAKKSWQLYARTKSQCVDGEANIKWNLCVLGVFFCNSMSYVLLNVSVNKPSANCGGGSLLMHSRYVNLIGHILYSPSASCQGQPFLAGVKNGQVRLMTSTHDIRNIIQQKNNNNNDFPHSQRGDIHLQSALSHTHTHTCTIYIVAPTKIWWWQWEVEHAIQRIMGMND